jgi:hypothetical protein
MWQSLLKVTLYNDLKGLNKIATLASQARNDRIFVHYRLTTIPIPYLFLKIYHALNSTLGTVDNISIKCNFRGFRL